MTADAAPDPQVQRRRCACGCGGWTSRKWMRNHDQNAVREMVSGLGFPGLVEMFAAYRDDRLVVLPNRRGKR